MAFGVGPVQQVKILSPQEHLANALELRAAQLQIDQQESETAAKLKADAATAKRQAWLQTAAQTYRHDDGSPDWVSISKAAQQDDPVFGLELSERIGKAQDQEATLHTKQLKNKLDSYAMVATLAERVDDDDSYQRFRAAAQQIDPELKDLPEQFDPNYLKQVIEQGYLNADYSKRQLDLEKQASEGLISADKYLGGVLSLAQSQEDVDDAFRGAAVRYRLNADQVRAMRQEWGAQFEPGFAERAAARSMTPNERQDNATSIANSERMADAAIQGQLIASGNLDVARGNLDVRRREAAEGTNERIVQIMGPNGTPIWVRESQAVGQPAAQAARAVTGAERQVLAFYNRAKEAVETLTKPGDNGALSLEQKLGKAGAMSQAQLNYAHDALLTSEQRAYRQAQRAFTEARLRKESGAAIPTAEYINDAKTYFVQPGDDAKNVEQKRKARQTVLDGLKFAAGKAYDEFYGEPNTPAGQGPQPTMRFNPATGKVEPIK